jgi:hypothetical protein
MKTGMLAILALVLLQCAYGQKEPATTDQFPSSDAAMKALGNHAGIVVNPGGSGKGDPSSTGLNHVYIDFNENVPHSGAIRLLNVLSPSVTLSAGEEQTTTLFLNNHASNRYSGSGGPAKVDTMKIMARGDASLEAGTRLNAMDIDVATYNAGDTNDEHGGIVIFDSVNGANNHGGMWGEDVHVIKPAGVPDGRMVGIEIGMHKAPPLGAQKNIGLDIWAGDTQSGSIRSTRAGNAIQIEGGSGWTNAILYRDTDNRPLFRLDDKGHVHAYAYETSGADFAESVGTNGPASSYQPGDVVVIDSAENNRLAKAMEPYSTAVAGIVSRAPGILGSDLAPDKTSNEPRIPLAIVGIVPCKVTTENGRIRRGDLLVSSGKPGYAMKGTDRNRLTGAVIGKAMESLDAQSGVIRVLVSLQ